jgi:hypothetical protein
MDQEIWPTKLHKIMGMSFRTDIKMIPKSIPPRNNDIERLIDEDFESIP